MSTTTPPVAVGAVPAAAPIATPHGLAAEIQLFVTAIRTELAGLERALIAGGANAIDSIRGGLKNIETHTDAIHLRAGTIAPPAAVAPSAGQPIAPAATSMVAPAPVVNPTVPPQTIQPPQAA